MNRITSVLISAVVATLVSLAVVHVRRGCTKTVRVETQPESSACAPAATSKEDEPTTKKVPATTPKKASQAAPRKVPATTPKKTSPPASEKASALATKPALKSAPKESRESLESPAVSKTKRATVEAPKTTPKKATEKNKEKQIVPKPTLAPWCGTKTKPERAIPASGCFSDTVAVGDRLQITEYIDGKKFKTIFKNKTNKTNETQ